MRTPTAPLLSLALLLTLAGCGLDPVPTADTEGASDSEGDDTEGGTEGEDLETFPGLSAPVDIKVDDRGIPHIYGQTDLDVMYAAGYQMATDRLFQMDLMRRRAMGRQAEVLGPDFVAQDELSRLMDFPRWGAANADRLREEDPEIYRFVVAWMAGVNERIRQINAGEAPMPYGFGPGETNTAPEAWTIEEHSSIAKLLFFGSTNSLERELLATIVARLLPDTWDRIELARPMFNVATMPADELPASSGAPLGPRFAFEPPRPLDATAMEIEAAIATLRHALDHVPRTGSNNWAVDGRFTDTGRPYVAGDPHQPLDSPSVLYAQHLSSMDGGGTMDVIGFSFAGAAGVHMGHNRNLQWTATVNFADVMDVWEVEVVDDGAAIMAGGERVEIVERTETIEVAGESAQSYVVQDVPGYGVILPRDLVPIDLAAPDHALLFNWIGFAGTSEEKSFMRMATASNVDEYEAAVDQMENGAFNFISADADSISYRVRIDVPDRGDPSARQMPYIVVDGDDPGSFWSGDALSRDEVPSSRADGTGWVATANNDPWGFTFDGDVHNDPWYYGYFYAAGHRAQRIEQELTRLTGDGGVTREAMQTLQLDTHSPMADVLLPVLTEAWDAIGDDEALAEFADRPELLSLFEALTGWDRQMRRESPEALIFHVWLHLLTEEVVGDELSILYGTVMAEASAYMIKLPGLAVTGVYPQAEAIMAEGRNWLVLRALERTAEHLAEVYGDVDPAGYSWQERHGTFFDSPFGERLEVGFVPTDGGEDTVNVSSSRFASDAGSILPRFESTSGAVYRLVTTFAEDGTPQAWVNFPPGNSADPDSPHFSDTLEDWVEGVYTRLPFTPAEVDAVTETTITLAP